LSKELKSNTTVITIRINKTLKNHLDKMKSRFGLSKADIIRNYLEMSRYFVKQKSSIKSLNDRDLIIIKRSFLRNLLEECDEVEQINLGNKLGRFINDISRIEGYLNDTNYTLNLCESLGFFPKLIDNDKYVLITKEFGPIKFVEAFILQIMKQKDYNPRYVESELKGSKSLQSQYEKDMGNPIERSSSHYSFEIAKLPEEE
jgi:hypothetical protein